MYGAKIDLTQHLNTKISLFLHDELMRKHAAITLKHMGFTDVSDNNVPRNYFEALSKIVPIIASDTEIVLMNLPPRPYKSGGKEELVTIYDMVNDNYADIKTHLAKRNSDPLKLLSKTIPLIEVGDYLRDKLIEVLARYRVPAAFFLTAPMTTKKSETQARKAWKAKKNLELFFTELSTYINYYFRDKDELVTLVDDKLTEKELTERKKKYEQLMAEANKLRERGDLDRAIAILRQAIEVFPQDIEAFMESGRLYTRKREYGRALIRYGQAQDLFEEAPEPNKEIGTMRLTQVKEKISAGTAPDSPEIVELVEEAVANFKEAVGKAQDLLAKYPDDPEKSQPESLTNIGSEVLKWNLGGLLGENHPAVKELLQVVQETTQGLNGVPIDKLSAQECLTLGMHALEKMEIQSAELYYFQALKDPTQFKKVCFQINLMGVKLRQVGFWDDALEILEKLLDHDPPNQAAIFWNMAVTHDLKKDVLETSGYTARCLFTDPDMAKEDIFYENMTPELAKVLIKLIKTLRAISGLSAKINPPQQLIKLYQARRQLGSLIESNQRNEALKLFLTLVNKVPKFTINPEFHADGVVQQFLQEIRAPLAANIKQQANAKTINSWLKFVAKSPAPPSLAQFMNFSDRAVRIIEENADKKKASYYLGKAIATIPINYFEKPFFYARKYLPALAREMSIHFQYVNPDRFPKLNPPEAAGNKKPAPNKNAARKAAPANKKK